MPVDYFYVRFTRGLQRVTYSGEEYFNEYERLYGYTEAHEVTEAYHSREKAKDRVKELEADPYAGNISTNA